MIVSDYLWVQNYCLEGLANVLIVQVVLYVDQWLFCIDELVF